MLWFAETLGLLLAGLTLGGSAYLALATASVALVFTAVGAVLSQLAPTKRGALQLGLGVFVVAFLMRIAADTSGSLEWLRWLTPLGWAEELRPFTGAQPAVLVVPLGAAVLLLVLAARIYATRDIGAGLLPSRDSAPANPRMLGSTTAHALREERGTLVIWMLALAAVGLVVGIVSKSINRTIISPQMERELVKFGVSQVDTPRGYIAFAFLLVVPAVSAFMCAQVGAARREEEEQRLETLFALPVGRIRWLAGRLGLAVAGAVAVSLVAASPRGLELTGPACTWRRATCSKRRRTAFRQRSCSWGSRRSASRCGRVRASASLTRCSRSRTSGTCSERSSRCRNG